MDKWSEEDRIREVELFIETRSIIATQRAFRQHCHRRHIPDSSRPTIRQWVAKWPQDGLVCDKKSPGPPKNVRTQRNIDCRQASIRRSSRRSLR
ncbi:hypothetical protein C0J52_13920 [Blattella germanica]|nr:hypothetical protein C0J52_13920 [Blattella germanica]